MKRLSTFVALATIAIAASAQTSSGTVTFSTLVDKTLTTKALSSTSIVNENTLYGTVKVSSGLSAKTVQATYKNLKGTSVNFASGKGYIKFTPTGTASSNYSSYVDFKVEEADVDKVFGDLIVEFDASRVGTDALNLQAEVIFKGDGSGTTGKILTETNWKKYTNGESWTQTSSAKGSTAGVATEDAWTPICEDLSCSTNTSKSSVPYNHVKIVVSNSEMPDYSYAATLRIYDTNASASNSFLVENVKFTFVETGTTGIEEVSANAAAPKAVKKIVNGKLVIEKGGRQYSITGAQF